VVEQGKHEALLNLGGIYAEFYEKQHFEQKD
jgi:ABC-type multidrug transport system fused ATPase/permease subunit